MANQQPFLRTDQPPTRSSGTRLSTVVTGLMSGTSVDGIDVAVCRFEENLAEPGQLELEVLGYSEHHFPASLKVSIFEAFAEQAGPAELCELNFEIGEVFAGAALQGLQASGLSPQQVDLIASHGQTIYHQVAAGRRASTLQMGDGAIIADRSGVTVAHDFRTADMAAGGQGAPLVPYFDRLFFARPGRNLALQNIGGIGNVTFLPGDGHAPLALDTGPGNALIDCAARQFSQGAQQFDFNGAMAAQGGVNPAWLAELMSHPYIEAPLPKSTGREVFGDTFARLALARAAELGLEPADTMATLTAFTAKSIAAGLKRFNPGGQLDQLVVSGGGARNAVLMDMLGEWLPGIEVVQHDAYGVKAEAKEAVAFALLGYELLRNRPANVPECTGASRPVLLGKLAPGLNYAALLGKYAPVMEPGRPACNDFVHEEEITAWPRMPRLVLKGTR